jgi:hypothetical protein
MYYTDDFHFEEFRALVLTELHLRHVPFERRDLFEFLRVMRPLITDDDTPIWWADAFLEADPSPAASTN